LAVDRDDVHSALTQLFSPGGALETPPSELAVHFDDLAIARTAKAYMRLQDDVSTGGHAVVVTAGPPGAGKSEARETMALQRYRVIDPDVAKDLLLRDADANGLLAYRHTHVLPDGKPVGIRELAAHIHSASSRTTDVVRRLALSAGENVVLDGTLSWRPLIDVYINELFSAGYEDLEVVNVEAPLHVATERARTRWWHGRQRDLDLGGRFVAEKVIQGYYENHSWQSSCAANALILAERAADELGAGKLSRFDVDPATGVVTLSSETVFR
jgi:dephospho-CoA kinase